MSVESRHLPNDQPERPFRQRISAAGVERPCAFKDSPEFSLFIPNGARFILRTTLAPCLWRRSELSKYFEPFPPASEKCSLAAATHGAARDGSKADRYLLSGVSVNALCSRLQVSMVPSRETLRIPSSGDSRRAVSKCSRTRECGIEI